MPDFLFPKERIINRRIPGAPAPLKVPLYVAKLWSESPTALAQEHPHKKNTTNTVCVLSLAANHPQDFHFVGPDYCSGSRLVLVPGCPHKKNTPRLRGCFYFWWPWSDSNRHSLQNLILSQARLPIPPRGQNCKSSIRQRPFSPQPFLPGGRCVSACVPAFSQELPVCQLSFQSLS